MESLTELVLDVCTYGPKFSLMGVCGLVICYCGNLCAFLFYSSFLLYSVRYMGRRLSDLKLAVGFGTWITRETYIHIVEEEVIAPSGGSPIRASYLLHTRVKTATSGY